MFTKLSAEKGSMDNCHTIERAKVARCEAKFFWKNTDWNTESISLQKKQKDQKAERSKSRFLMYVWFSAKRGSTDDDTY